MNEGITFMSTATMNKLTRDSLMTLEAYAKARPTFRKDAMAHKKLRTVHIGEHITLLFEDEMTIRYQVQEVLRIEKAFEEAAIVDELEAYNPLIPEGRDFRATMLIEYGDEAERRVALTKMKGVERKTWVQVEGAKKVYAIADEDLERDDGTKTSAVHFLRFPITDEMAAALKYGVTLQMGCDHAAYQMTIDVPTATRNALVKDLR
jgi:hypothetical protein